MKPSRSYVLVLNQDSNDLNLLKFSLQKMSCPVVVAHSAAQAIATATQAPPYLVILVGNQNHWTTQLIKELRKIANHCGMTIVALTDFHAPSWMPQEENPGLDGFLVKPLNCDVLLSLVQSARARQSYCMNPSKNHMERLELVAVENSDAYHFLV